jgi:hypothetical protein
VDVMDWSKESIDKKVTACETRLDTYQNEYWDILVDLIDNPESRITDKKPKYYWIERLKELQLSINFSSNYIREIRMEMARTSLEEAFTPKIKSMLIEDYEKKIKELQEDE